MNTDWINNFIVILLFGSLILLSFIKFTNPLKLNKKANYWFGGFLLLWATFWVEEISLMGMGKLPGENFTLIIRNIQFYTPVFFFISVTYFTNPKFKFSTKHITYLILPMAFLIVLLLKNNQADNPSSSFDIILSSIIIIQLLIFSIASFIKIKRHQKKIQLFYSSTEGVNLNWLEYIITMILIISLISIINTIFFQGEYLSIFVNVIFLFFIYAIAYYSLMQKETFPLDDEQYKDLIEIDETETSSSERKKLISDEELIGIKESVTKLMVEKEVFLDSDLNLIKMSELLNISPHQLSYVINTGFNENFYQFINKYRVEKTKELLLKKEMDNLSILGIAYESGFNSKTSFYTVFKKITGITPSEFKKRSSSL